MKHSIDRIDNDGHYETGNIRWATADEQSRNKRNNALITIGDETKCVTDWAIVYKSNPDRIDMRRKRKWCDFCAVTLPLNSNCPHR